MKVSKAALLFILFALTVVGCRQEQPSSSPAAFAPTAVLTPTAAATPTVSEQPASASPSAPAPTDSPPPTAVIAASTATAPITISAAPGVPPALRASFQAFAGERPGEFTWVDGAADVTLVPSSGESVSRWVYALVAPFNTIADGVGAGEMLLAWQEGRLAMTPDIDDLLRASWGTPATAAESLPAGAIPDALWSRGDAGDVLPMGIVPFEELEPRLKVLAVDELSPVRQDFAAGEERYPLSFDFGLVGAPEKVAAVLAAWEPPASNRDESRMTRVAMTGPAGMRRAVADRMERYGINYPGEETGPVLQAADIAHMSNENAFASNCPPPDPNDSVNVCNRDEYIVLMEWMGIDVNEMTGNHLNDWGSAALLHTFDLYDERGIRTFGGGRDLAHAAEPLIIEHNGNRLAFVGCIPVGPPFSWATETSPGALPCGDYTAIRAQIAELAEQGYLVIATLQYLEDYQYEVLDAQRRAFDWLAEAGATVVSGSHAHHPQGFGFPAGAFVHYGLGNLLADQMWSLGSRQMFIDTHLFYDGRLINVDLWSGINEDFARVRKMTPEERAALLEVVFSASPW